MSSHELLKVEVSQLLTLLQLQKLKKLGIGVNLATVVLILKLLGANVGIHLTSNLGTRKNTALGPAEKSGQLVGNQGGLDETRRSAVSVGLATLVGLVGDTKLTGVLALELVHLGTNRSNKRLSALKLAQHADVESRRDRTLDLGDGSGGLTLNNRSSGNNGHSSGGGLRGSLGSSLGLGDLGCGSGRSSRSRSDGSSDRRSSSGRRRRRRRSRLDHVIGYTLMSKVFLS